MAVQYYGINRGDGFTPVTVDSSTTSSDFEFAVDDTNTPTKEEAITALQKIIAEVMESDWPFA